MENIKYIINNWDPVGVFPCATEDEYNQEIYEIADNITENTTPEELGEIIYTIFLNNYESAFAASKEECIEISNEILEE